MPDTAKLYRSIGGARGCHALAMAFYAHVERDPILRPLFPSTFTCAIEEFSAFLVQFLGGETEAMQRRWWLSLRESHARFRIGQRERDAWLHAMSLTLAESTQIADPALRNHLLDFFRHASSHIVRHPEPAIEPENKLAPLWAEQLALDEVVALIRAGEGSRCVELLRSPVLQARFARSPSVHASVLALAATAQLPELREYAIDQLRSTPSLARERYQHSRTLLHDAAAAGDVDLAELLLAMGASPSGDGENRSPLYCVANECRASSAGDVARALLRTGAEVDEVYGVKRCTALHMAARRGNLEVIEALLEAGASIEARDSAGVTPLRRALNCRKQAAARLLLALGARPFRPPG